MEGWLVPATSEATRPLLPILPDGMLLLSDELVLAPALVECAPMCVRASVGAEGPEVDAGVKRVGDRNVFVAAAGPPLMLLLVALPSEERDGDEEGRFRMRLGPVDPCKRGC